MTSMRLTDIGFALALLSRIPLRIDHGAASERAARAAWAFPVAGALLGALALAMAWLADSLGLPAAASAGVLLLTLIMATGAMHEDGLADSADGLWGGWTPERRLEIMKDSRIGTYGVLALVLGCGLRWSCLTALIAADSYAGPVLAVAILSRAPMLAAMCWAPAARPGGLSASVGRVPENTALIGLTLAAVLSLLAAGITALAALIAVTAVAMAGMRFATSRIGGQTGDILGALQQLSEVTALMVFAATLS